MIVLVSAGPCAEALDLVRNPAPWYSKTMQPLVVGERPEFVGVKMPASLVARLDAEAKRRGVKRSVLVRDAIEALLIARGPGRTREGGARGRKS